MDKCIMEALAYEEAQRLLEKEFSFYNPYSCVMEAEDIPYSEQEIFFDMVEEELALKGEKILRRRGEKYFKIAKYQAKKTAK